MIKEILNCGYEWRSKAEIFSLPLVHIAVGKDIKTGKLLVAKGIIAIGQFAIGIIAIGQFAIGLIFGLAQFAVGIFAVAQFALGIIFGMGQFATGITAIGQFTIGNDVLANDTLIGNIAPSFKVISADKEILTLDNIKGKVAVLFYESKNAIEQNRKLKDALNIFYARQPDPIKKDIIRIGVINCQGVLFRGAWENGLRSNSLKEGITIYGDWDGKMSGDYRTRVGESNLIIVDKKGVIRYYASGRLEDKETGIIEGLLERLVWDRE